MRPDQSSSGLLRAMALEADAAATAAEERAKMAERGASHAHGSRLVELSRTGAQYREAAAFHRRRQQALEDGARLLEAAEAAGE